MMKYFLLVVLFVYFASANYNSNTEEPTLEEIAQKVLESKAYRKITNLAQALHFAEFLRNAFKNYDPVASESMSVQNFSCKSTGRSDPPPTEATKLLPGDIDILIAMGDSLTAGFGADATSLFNLFTDYRGASFSIGGSKTIEQCSTIANIFQLFNPNIEGYSVGSGNENSANAKLNVAVTGARSYDLPYQVDLLVSKLQDYNTDGWKLLTLFIGGNDLCDACDNPAQYSADIYKANVEVALDSIKSQVSNVFVNVVLPPDVSLLSQITGVWCSFLHLFECSCNTDPSTSPLHKEYIQALHDLVALPKYHDKPDFHVVIQPFLEDIVLPLGSDGKPDKSYFAPDCFHFSTKSHAAAGLSLWNNMLETTANKKREWVPGEPFECPEEGQYLQ